jgi:hypothetical protein
VLLLHRRLPTPAVLAGMTAALALGRLEADLVAVEARRHLEPVRVVRSEPAVQATRTVGEQPRPVPTLGSYDSLLTPLEISA